MADIELPQLGESVTEGTITRWFKAVGDQVAEDEPLFEVSTDKVDSEVPSPSAGYVAEILVEEGDTVDVGTKVAVLSDGPPSGGSEQADAGDSASDGDDGGSAGSGSTEEQPEQPDTGDAASSAVDPEPTDAPAPSSDGGSSADAGSGDEQAAPAAAEAAADDEVEAAPKARDQSKGAPAGGAASGGPVLSPVVRRLLDQAGLDAAEVTGTGIGGRVTRSDAEAHVRDHGGSAAPQPAPTSTPAAASPAQAAPASRPARNVEPAIARGTDQPKPLSKIRAITAQHMVRSLATSAHAYVSTEVDYEAVERVRTAHKTAFKEEEGTSLTYLPFVARALVDAVAEYPQINASMGEETDLVVHGSVNLGIAVDLHHEGLIVPVVHDAQDQRLRAIARHVADLAGRARGSELTADDITGGTVTITNVGSTGNVFLLPIINQPQVMILATDGVRRRPVVITDEHGSESIAIHSVGNLTLGWDHRAFDGAYAAEFLARVREILETRDWESEL
jgi:pyruvate dehydrogenase E2 component (dihydrolipoamide acetyltransferase)